MCCYHHSILQMCLQRQKKKRRTNTIIFIKKPKSLDRRAEFLMLKINPLYIAITIKSYDSLSQKSFRHIACISDTSLCLLVPMLWVFAPKQWETLKASRMCVHLCVQNLCKFRCCDRMKRLWFHTFPFNRHLALLCMSSPQRFVFLFKCTATSN